MNLIQKIRENAGIVLKPLAPIFVAGAMYACAPNRIEKFDKGESYKSFGVVKEKIFSPDYETRMYNLKVTNSKGETFVDNYHVGIVDIPEFPNTIHTLNSPSLYNSVEVGDTVDLVLQSHNNWIENSEGNRLSRTYSWISIDDYFAREKH